MVVKTPNIDRIARRGIKFDHAYASYPVCAPSRGAMATGRYPSVNGHRQNGCVLPDSELTLMEVLRRAGYVTYGAGKMHLGPQWRETGSDPDHDQAVNPQPEPWEMPWNGFEKVWITEDNRVGPYAKYLEEHGYDVWADPHSFTYPQHITRPSAYPEEHYQSTWIGDKSLEMLEDHPEDKPFFLWTSFVDPHHPFTPPKPFDSMYDPDDMPLPVWDEGERQNWPEQYHRKFNLKGPENGHEAIGMCDLTEDEFRRIKAYYYGLVSLIDKQVGRLLEYLEDNGWLENTVIIFTSDHGELLGDHGLMFKGATYPCVMSVPFLISYPGRIQEGEGREALTVNTDIMPTVLDYCGLDIPPGVQGRSLKAPIDVPEAEIYDDLLIENGGNVRSLRTRDELLTWRGPSEIGDLFDLKNDSNCLHNLWDDPEWQERKKELLDRLMERLVNNVDPLPLVKASC
jgi:arylsulfatase A-like enzyme